MMEEQKLQSNLKILFVDDHRGLIEGFGFGLKAKNSNFDFLYATNRETAIQVLNENPDICVVILDLSLATENGFDLIEDFRKVKSSTKILIFTMDDTPLSIEKAIKLNVQGYITKDCGIAEIEKALIEISNGNTYFNEKSRLIQKVSSAVSLETSDNEELRIFALYKTISKKEQDVVKLLLENKSDREIADILGKSQRTIENQRYSIYKKLEVNSFGEFFNKARILGIV